MSEEAMMRPTESEAVQRHYTVPDLGDVILRGLKAAGKSTEAFSPDDLSPIDQFHTLGRQSTLELLRLAELRPEMRVVDVGGGLGGPARTLATEVGCHVMVLDLSEEFCRVGEMLTERTGLAGRVSFRQGNATAQPFADRSFDAAWTQHSSMNIADKERLDAEIHRVLRPGGRLALYEVMAGPGGEPHYPTPWASTPVISFLRPPEEIRRLLQETGFHELVWRDVTNEARDGVARQMAAATSQASPLGLHLVMPNFREAAANHVRNL
ncbi:MAG: class I SAM-dependent methyltransferase, partial [Dehalococcoidia bacterium]